MIVNEKTVLRSVEINLAEIDTLLLSRNETELVKLRFCFSLSGLSAASYRSSLRYLYLPTF